MTLYAIREVSELTGIKPVTLRAWQRRYGLLKPQRTESGHRLYSEADLETIRAIQGWLAKGVSIGRVKVLLQSEEVPESDERPPVLAESDLLLTALSHLHAGKTSATIGQVLKEYPLAIVTAQFVYPVLEALERVKASQRSLQKGLLQSQMMAHLVRALDAESRAATQGRALMVNMEATGCLPAWLEALALSERGYKVSLLDGVDDLSALAESDVLQDISLVYVYANRRLPVKQVENLRGLGDSAGYRLECSPLVMQQLG